MRKYLLTLGLGISGIVLALYLTRILPPFDEETINQLVITKRILSEEELLLAINELSANGGAVLLLNWRNLGLIALLGALGIANLFAFLHLVLAKITSSPFGIKPKASTAIRRGIEASVVLAALALFRLTLAETYLFFVVPLFVLILEIAITQQLNKPTAEELALSDEMEADLLGVNSLQRDNLKIRKDPTQAYDMPEIEENGDFSNEEGLISDLPEESAAPILLEKEDETDTQ